MIVNMVPPPRNTLNPTTELWVHVVRWLQSDQFEGDPDRSAWPVGWVQVWRNPEYGFHLTFNTSADVRFRRPGDDQSHPAEIDGWETIGDLPEAFGGGRSVLTHMGPAPIPPCYPGGDGTP